MSARYSFPLYNGTAVVGGDLHTWKMDTHAPGWKPFVRVIEEVKPAIVVVNGDVINGSRISQHPRIGWEDQPMVEEELRAAQSHLGEVEQVANTLYEVNTGTMARNIPHFGVELVWNMGNHDERFETRLAKVAPEYEGIKGIHLKDHFPAWRPAWSTLIGDPKDGLIVKHRLRGGVNAARSNVAVAGMSIATGHTHQMGLYVLHDYAGTKYGVECGMLASDLGPQFKDYLEDNPRNWTMGFCVFRFIGGRVLMPELVRVRANGAVEWRGTMK